MSQSLLLSQLSKTTPTTTTASIEEPKSANLKTLVIKSEINDDRLVEQQVLQSGSAMQEMRLEDEENPGSFSTRYVYIKKNGDICVTVFRETAV